MFPVDWHTIKYLHYSCPTYRTHSLYRSLPLSFSCCLYLNHGVGRNVVLEIDVHPFHALTAIHFLFLLQHRVDKHLLKSLIAVVDAKLFKTEETQVYAHFYNPCECMMALICYHNNSRSGKLGRNSIHSSMLLLLSM